MECPCCGERLDVIESRDKKNGYVRRRECPACGKRFVTIETVTKEYEKGEYHATGLHQKYQHEVHC